MNKKIIGSLLVATLLAGCNYNDDNFEGLIKGDQPTDVKKLDYTLTDADYAAVSSNAANKAIAIGKSKQDSIALANLKTTRLFTSTITAEEYLPAFLASTYFTADDGSAIKVTYNQQVSLPDYVNELNTATIYTLAADDYKKVWGDKSSLNFFTPSKPAATYLPAILATKVANPVEGQIVCASYNVSEAEPAAMTIAFKEDFETGTAANTNIDLADWTNTTVVGTFKWQAKLFSGNMYAQQTGYKHTGDLDSYLISKEIAVEKGMSLTFDALYANLVAGGGAITVLVSTNLTDATTVAGINAATWDNLTAKFTIPTSPSGSGDMVNAGAADLSAYVGKKVRVAFRYQGNGTTATTTTRIDNIAISTPGKNTYLMVNTLYSYAGTAWTLYTTPNVLMLSQADFNLMGSKYDNFSSTMNPDNYLSTFLKQKYMYAQENDVKVPVYKFYNSTSKVTSIRADEYIFTTGQFVKNDAIESMTDQFVLSKGKWQFDPSVVITLSTSRADKKTSLFYQTITDWVKENKGTQYVTTYGNNDYYFGGSAYNNNFDFRLSAWRGQVASEYGDLSDADLTKLMFSRLPEAFVPALEILYADAKPVTGIDVLYIINFSIYDGSATLPYVIKYKVVGNGKFEYIKDSLAKV